MSRHSDERDGVSSAHWTERGRGDIGVYPPFDVFKQPGKVPPRLNADAGSFQTEDLDDEGFAAAQARRVAQLYRAQSVPAMAPPKEAAAAWTPKNARSGGAKSTAPPTDAASTGNASTLSADEELRLLDEMNKLKLSSSTANAGTNTSSPISTASLKQPGSTTASPGQASTAAAKSSRSAQQEKSPVVSPRSSSARVGAEGDSVASGATPAASVASASTGAVTSSAPTASAQMAAAATAPEFAMGASSATTTMGGPASFGVPPPQPQHPHQHLLHPQPHHMHGNPYSHPHPMGGHMPPHPHEGGLGGPHEGFMAAPAVPSPAFYLPPHQDMMQRPPQQPVMQWQQPMQYGPPPLQRPATVGPLPQAQICKYFGQGSCAKGDQCGYLHVFATKATAMVGAKMNNGALPFQPHHQQPSVGAFDNGDGASTAYSDHSSVHPHSLRANGLGAANTGGGAGTAGTPVAGGGSANGSRRAGGGGSGGGSTTEGGGSTKDAPSAGAGSSNLPGSHSPPLNRGRFAGTQQSVGAFSNTRTPHPPHFSGLGGAPPPPSPIVRSYSSLGHMTGAGGGGRPFDEFNGFGGGDVTRATLHRHQSTFLPGDMPGAGGQDNDFGFLTPRASQNPLLNGDQPKTARDIATQVYILAKDQHGCRLLQRMLEDRDKLTFEVIFTEVFRHINELMTDPFGNYLIQKLMDFATDEQRLKILHKVAHDLVAISLNIHGTRVVQKMLEVMTTDAEKQLVVRATRTSVVTLTKDLNGNHVIQRCLQHMEAEYNQFIYDAISIHCVSVATHKHGCCVLQRCIDFAVERQRIQLISVIVTNALELVQDAFGNYVVQYVIDNAGRQVSRALMKQLLGSISNLAVQKFSSNVIEKCLQNADDDIKVCIIDELIDPQRLPRLLQDPYANYVIQKALSVTKQERFNYLIELIRPHVRALRATSFGKRIQSKIIKRFPILAMDDPPMGPADHQRVNVY